MLDARRFEQCTLELVVDRRTFCLSLIALPSMIATGVAEPGESGATSARKAVWDQSEEIRFSLSDPLEHPFYWWPRTMLSYPIEFVAAGVNLDRLHLTRVDTREQVPIQFSDEVHDNNGLRSATLHFISDLPSGGAREFVLSTAKEPTAASPLVHEHREGTSIVLDSGSVRVRIPATQAVHGVAPGPIEQMSRGSRWMGSSTFALVNDRVLAITARRIAAGPLFVAYELTYETVHSGVYIATVQCDADFEFVRLRENMEGLHAGARGEFTTNWNELGVTHRQAANHPFPVPDKARPYEEYWWETIDAPWQNLDARCGSSRAIYPETMPAGQLPIVLGIYQPAPGNFVVSNWANFWNQSSGDALGVFIDDATEWRDHEYAYELESPTLQLRMYYESGRFRWVWPVARGCRSTCIACYDHELDKQTMTQLERDAEPLEIDGTLYQSPLGFTSRTLFLQNRYGTLDLNRVKDWVLVSPEDGERQRVIFTGGPVQTAAELESSVMSLPYVCTLPITGVRQMDGSGPLPGRGIVNFSPVPSRRIEGSWIDGFNRLNASMTARQRRRLTAVYLLLAYVQGGDEFMPVVPMLSGHPNYLGDVKFAPAAMSFLFPQHPLASLWADMWEKSMEMNTRYNVRPAVDAWDADGGRWTEDIGTYVWAFLRPALRAEFLLRQLDGVERFVSPQLAWMAEWLVNALSAPFGGESKEGFANLLAVNNGRGWGVVGPGEGPRRVYPPVGAHSERRMPPRSLWYLGTCLQRYAPMAAEHAMWASRPTDNDAEAAPGSAPPWDDIMYAVKDNRGTNPHLRSRKHTGYGVVLRAAVETPDEVSLHLQQIDEGPNYRWGWAGEGGCGVLYFFAAGKAYGFNGAEDVGDRRDQDTDFCTNFGVFKDGDFRSVGQNVLSRPFYDLSCGQFAEIVPRQGTGSYSAPEYVSRSMLLAGHDYFVLADLVSSPSIVHRLSWFVRRGDELPFIHRVRGGGTEKDSPQRTAIETSSSTGVWFDGQGDSIAVVSHRRDLRVEATPFGCRVRSADVDDQIFRSASTIHFSDGERSFDGTAGIFRNTQRGVDFAMFHGTHIAVEGWSFKTSDTDLGIGGSIVNGKTLRGEYSAAGSSAVSITTPAPSAAMRFYIDGEAQPGDLSSGVLMVNLKQGRHHWEVSDSLPVPVAPIITRTENRSGGARFFVGAVAGATRYRVEVSSDNGGTGVQAAVESAAEVEVKGLRDGQKYHVRAVALNAMQESVPGPEYPLYVSAGAPAPPDGVRMELSDSAATITWGEILGVTEYRLYARAAADEKFHLIEHGPERCHVDRRAGIRGAVAVPATRRSKAATLIEYCVTAVNGNGESVRSRIVNTDEGSWQNWDPRPGEGFRRVYSFPNDATDATRPRYYPR
jgi:hypothetical protein